MNPVKYVRVIFFILFFLPIYSYASSYLSTLDKIYKQDEFRIYYTLDGDNALPKKNQIDSNNNKIPDYVENIANQLSEASKLLIDNFKFIHPLAQPRFKGKAHFIDIHLIPIKVNGAAGDVVDEKNSSLVIKFSLDLVPYTLTPLHEFFHLIQYGYSMFNNRWSMEGQARWVEYAFRKGTGKHKKLPSTIQEINELTKTIYESSYFWERIAFLSDKSDCSFNHEKEYKNIFTDKYWIEDEKLCGIDIIKNILENYQKYDKEVAKLYGFTQYGWSEKEQKSPNNDLYILLAIRDTLNNIQNKNTEIIDFINVINRYKSLIEKEQHVTKISK